MQGMSKEADWSLSRAKYDKNEHIIWTWPTNLAAVSGWEAEKAGDEQGDGDKKREAKASSDGEAHVDSTQQVKCIWTLWVVSIWDVSP